MSNNGPFGIDPEEFERALAEAGEGIREAFDMFGKFLDRTNDTGGLGGLGGLVNDLFVAARPRPESRTTQKAAAETVEDAGGGVWVVYTLDDDGSARVEQAYATELDALRAHKNNVDPARKVRFLPYGVTVSLLDSVD